MTKEQLIKGGYKLVDTIGEHDIYGIEGSSVYYAMARDMGIAGRVEKEAKKIAAKAVAA